MSESSKMKNKEYVLSQYATTDKLQLRIDFHNKYSTNKLGYYPWLYSQYEFATGMKVLELGSGKGDIWKDHIADVSNRIKLVLSDLSEAMVGELNSSFRSNTITVKKVDIQDIPYEENTFDAVIANAMLYHVPDIHKGLAEIARVLKPGGLVYTATFGMNGFMQFLYNSMEKIGLSMTQDTNVSFTLQNGEGILNNHFSKVIRLDYPDSLAIADTKDLIDYMLSTSIFGDLSIEHQNHLKAYFDSMKDSAGKLIIPKEYGTFISEK